MSAHEELMRAAERNEMPAEELTDEDFARMRDRIGKDLTIEQWNEEATRDTIRHYAFGIGDDNPLWLDDAYAARTRFGAQVAPPTFVYSVCDAEVAVGIPRGVQPLHVGAELDFYHPIRIGDRIRARSQLLEVRDVIGKRSGRIALQRGETKYYDQDDVLVARAIQTIVCVPRSRVATGLRYEPRPAYRYSQDELARIERDVLAEERRGARPRYWEDVREGDEVPPVVKGPLDRIAMTCYYAGAMGTAGYKGLEMRWKLQHRVRIDAKDAPNNFDAWYFVDPVFPSLGHQDETVAREIGMPGPYDNGNQRTSWLAHAVTNWVGDDGRLLFLQSDIKLPNVFGDTTWMSGTVSRKYEEDGQLRVEIALLGRNQLGDPTTGGRAIVLLPSRTERKGS